MTEITHGLVCKSVGQIAIKFQSTSITHTYRIHTRTGIDTSAIGID